MSSCDIYVNSCDKWTGMLNDRVHLHPYGSKRLQHLGVLPVWMSQVCIHSTRELLSLLGPTGAWHTWTLSRAPPGKLISHKADYRVGVFIKVAGPESISSPNTEEVIRKQMGAGQTDRPRRPDSDYPGTSAWHAEKLSQTHSLSHPCTGASSTSPVCNNSLALERPGMPSGC